MRCPECGANVPPLRLFCPQCGATVDPEMRERRAAGPAAPSDEQLRRNRKKVLAIGAAALLAIGVAKMSWDGPRVHFDPGDRSRGPAEVQAEEVYQAYRDDPRGAARRFRGREMVVTGEFLRVVPDGYGSVDLRFRTSNPEAPLGADLAGVAVDRAAELRPGQRVTVSCQRIAGGGDDPWLQNCAIQSAQEASAAPAPPEAPQPPPAPAPASSD